MNIFKLLMLWIAFISQNTFAQNCCKTHVYDGYISVNTGKKLDIKLNFLILLDSTLVGSYYYKPNQGSLKVVGKLSSDYTFYLIERTETDKITGSFKGKLTPDFKMAFGKWKDEQHAKELDFKITETIEESYWDYIEKNRSLYEYKGIKEAISGGDKVLALDVASQGLEQLPKALAGLNKIVSINLLGNNFTVFPAVLGKLKSLDEISLSSNRLADIGYEIGNLKNLRILIINNNYLKKLPKEIGNLGELLYLEVGNNQLTTLPDEIKNLTKLQELHIERNKFSENEKARIKKLLPNCVIHF